jgi:hypothetical protein
VEDDITYHEELDRNWIVKKRDTNHHCTDWYFCETFILDHFLQDWWGVATRAALGQSVVGQANTTILSGDMGSIRFEYNWYFQELVISGVVSPYLDLKCIHQLDVVDGYRNENADLLQLPYKNFFVWNRMICRVVWVENLFIPTEVKHGRVTKRRMENRIICCPVNVYTPYLTRPDFEITLREYDELKERVKLFAIERELILANLANPFQLVHVTPDYDGDPEEDTDDFEHQKMTALWNVKFPLNKAGARLYECVCRLALRNDLTEEKLFDELNWGAYSRDAFLQSFPNFGILLVSDGLNKTQLLRAICTYVVEKYNALAVPPENDAGTGTASAFAFDAAATALAAAFAAKAHSSDAYAAAAKAHGDARRAFYASHASDTADDTAGDENKPPRTRGLKLSMRDCPFSYTYDLEKRNQGRVKVPLQIPSFVNTDGEK